MSLISRISDLYMNLRKPIGVVGLVVKALANSNVLTSPTITTDTGAADATEPNGSIALRTDGPPEARVGSSWARVHLGASGGLRLSHDFEGPAGTTLPAWLATQDTSAAGAPTLDYINDAAGGQYQLKLADDNEVETISLYGGDQLTIDITKDPVFETRIKINPDVTGAGGQLAAGDKIVVGLASARNATLDSVVTHAWFRFEGANHNILWESDDGTTDDDDNDTTVDWVDDTFVVLKIDASDLTAVKFYVDGVLVGTGSIPLATGNLQVFIELQKAAAANKDHRLTVDYIDVWAAR